MKRLSERKIVLVKRKTRLEDLIARYNTVDQAKFYIEHLGADFTDYTREHEIYHDALASVTRTLSEFGRLQVIDRSYAPGFLFGPDDVAAALGQDGLVANTLKYLRGQPLVGINPDPDRWDGMLLPYRADTLAQAMPDVMANTMEYYEVTIAKAALNDGQTLYAVNDFFIGQRTHVSARYEIVHGKRRENHSSSGIIVSTGLGSTGWLTSVIAGAEGVSGAEVELPEDILWDSKFLYFSVREPFPTKTTGAEIVFGKVNKKNPLAVVSHMPENGVIFSDGVEKDFLVFNSGIEAKIGIAEFVGVLVG
ncbi:MAG: sugar kinase [Spirochaetes bacterium GWF1_51_8]|nr:MAG: sugar kinase [Spirochaetes bacterium GWF1_51_8]